MKCCAFSELHCFIVEAFHVVYEWICALRFPVYILEFVEMLGPTVLNGYV
jgi:hypothetical protein